MKRETLDTIFRGVQAFGTLGIFVVMSIRGYFDKRRTKAQEKETGRKDKAQ